ncbi:hypothetical protein H7U18_07285 [Klebsiella pneumoniae]|uniref:Uncharacterized protein n=1 Tax=Klebsiella pneumoniae TaxID=573 RepID=A0A923EPD4_KLEPN|nr:hypothetical protein [Klebsiella pneumoniae]
MQFNATVDSAVAANEVIKIDDQPEGASGLGVQILSAGGSLVPLNREPVWSGKRQSDELSFILSGPLYPDAARSDCGRSERQRDLRGDL